MMKVVYLTNIPSPYRINFFNELSKFCDLTVLFERTDASNRNNRWLKPQNIEFKPKFLDGIKVGNDSALCFEILRFIKHNKFDLIIIGGYSTPTGMLLIQYLHAKKIPFMLNCDGGIIKNDNKIKYCIKKYFISKASYYLSTGNKTNEYLINYGANKDKIFDFPFSSVSKKDILKSKNTEEIERLKKKLQIEEKKVVISVGQFIYRKGYDILLKAATKLDSDIGIYIVGGEPTEEYLHLVKELDLKNVHFVGFKTKEELSKYYYISDVFAFPTREDIWGLVINEAMANGLPIVTTNKCIAGVELVANGENGYIIESENQGQLAEAINKIIQDEKLKQKMFNNNIEKIQKYTIEEMAKRHIEIFNKILKENK